MSDDIVIGGGGSSAVATAELFDSADRLARLHGMLSECLGQLATIDGLVSRARLQSVDAPISSISAERALDDAALLIARALPSADRLHFALVASAEAYGITERSLQRLSQDVAARFGAVFGLFLPSIVFALLPVALGLGVGVATGIAVLPPATRAALARAMPQWLRNNSSALSDPRVVQLVRLTIMSADDVGGGIMRLPPDLVRLLGDEGLGVVGLATSSGAIVGLLRPSGALTETPVSVTRQGAPVAAVRPISFRDRADRIPEGAAQIRIDRYERAGEPDRFEVYIGGTRDFSLKPGTDPWDMTSNVNAIAGNESGSYRAVRQAMADAGVTATSPVMFSGYSQGGLMAAQLAASGEFDSRGLYTLGAPAAQVAVPASIPWVAIEHTDDIVPAVGGTWATADPVLVRRELLEGTPVDTSIALPAHRLDSYRQTAAIADRSGERRLVDSLAGFDAFGDGATAVESMLYRAERVSCPR